MASTRSRTHLRHPLVLFFFAFLLSTVGYVVATFEVLMHIPGDSITCNAPPPYLRPKAPWHAVFTARILYVGHIDSENAARSGQRFGPWAIAYVKHRYWGLPWWSSKIVVLAPGWFQEGETYFVDGRQGWLRYSTFLPIVYTKACNRTRLLSDAVVDTRILTQGPPPDGVRIIGRTYRRTSSGGYEPAPSMRVEIKGPNGSLFVTSDAEAVYDVSGVPAGHYAVQIEHPDRRDDYEAFDSSRDANVSRGGVWGRPVYGQ